MFLSKLFISFLAEVYICFVVFITRYYIFYTVINSISYISFLLLVYRNKIYFCKLTLNLAISINSFIK